MGSLVGRKVPDISLLATNGEWINLAQLSGKTVVFIYPYTGAQGVPDPEGWNDIAGAHGSTPQALAFSYRYAEFMTHNVKLFGLSLQDTNWQSDFVRRNQLRFPLLSDAKSEFASTLTLEKFKAGAKEFLVRRAFIIEAGLIAHDFYPVPKPAANADEVLQVLMT
jgi:peroxiredoxin